MAINNDADSGLSAEELEERMRTLWVGNLDEKCEDDVLYELFMNAGPLERLTQPTDKVTKKKKNFAFIVYEHEESIKYAYDLLNGVELYGSKLRLQHKQTGLGLYPRQPLQRGDRGLGGGGGHARSYSTSDLGRRGGGEDRNGGYNNFHGGGGVGGFGGGGGVQYPHNDSWRDNSRGFNHNFQNQPPLSPGDDYGMNPPPMPPGDHNPPLPPLPPPPMEDPRYGGQHSFNNQFNNQYHHDQGMYSRGQPYSDYNNSYQRSRDRGYDNHDRRDWGGHDDRTSRGHRDEGRHRDEYRDRSSHGQHRSSSGSYNGSSSHGDNYSSSSSYRRRR